MNAIRGRWLGAALVGIAVAVMLAQAAPAANAATREENIRKIEGFLSNQTVKENMQKKHGVSTERILKSLPRLSDAQVENLAQHANIQVGGALDRDSSDDFWTVYKWYLIISGVVFVVTMIALLAA